LIVVFLDLGNLNKNQISPKKVVEFGKVVKILIFAETVVL